MKLNKTEVKILDSLKNYSAIKVFIGERRFLKAAHSLKKKGIVELDIKDNHLVVISKDIK